VRFFSGLLLALIFMPVMASANCWDKPCIPPVKCCICKCKGMIGAASLDDPSKKDRNQLILPPAEEELAENNMTLPSEKGLQALLSKDEPEISTVR
jgi:tRNA-binding EMAP/Myf-like protein